MKNSGARLSPPDGRDHKIARLLDGVSGIPESFALPCPASKRQYAVGACVAFALSSILEAIYGRPMSEGFIYGYRPAGYYQGIGMIPREACETVLKAGDTLKADLPEVLEVDAMRALVLPRLDSLAPLAAPHRVDEYVRLQSKDEAAAFMLRYRLPILFVHQSGGLHAEVCFGWRGENALLLDSRGGVTHETAFKNFKEMWGLIKMEAKIFSDVHKGQWFYDAVMQAANDELMGGFPDGSFKPDEPVTRAQLAVILQRAGL